MVTGFAFCICIAYRVAWFKNEHGIGSVIIALYGVAAISTMALPNGCSSEHGFDGFLHPDFLHATQVRTLME